MKKNKVLFLIVVFFVSLFGFSLNVDADLKEDAMSNTCEVLKSNGKLDGENLLISNASSYDTNCIYTLTKEEQCIILQVAFNADGSFQKQVIPYYNFEWPETIFSSSSVWVIQGDNSFKEVDEQYFKERFGSCPSVKYSVDEAPACAGCLQYVYQEKFGFGGSAGTMMEEYFTNDEEFDIPPVIITSDPDDKQSCEEILGKGGVQLLKTIKSLFQILVPIVLVVLATIDVASAIFAGDENNMKKAQGKLMKRILIAVVIFLIPFLLQLLLNIGNEIWPDAIDATLCGIYD